MRALIIRKTKYRQLLYLLFCLVALYSLVTSNDWTRRPVLLTIITLVFLSLAIYIPVRIIKGEPEITLSDQGIDFRGYGFYRWSMISGFSLVEDLDSSTQELVFILRESRELKFHIEDLDKTPDEITALILIYSGNRKEFFTGHVRK